MSDLQTILIIDAGNTRLKIGVFVDSELVDIYRIGYAEIDSFHALVKRMKSTKLFISSVLSESQNQDIFEAYSPIFLSETSILPFTNLYHSSETLGKDRMANAAYMANHRPNSNGVVIDLGTCIKFDFLNHKNEYHGGSISPGLEMRYKALNHFTGKLPLLSHAESAYLGQDTRGSILAGVGQGIQGEINYFISRYEADYKDLTFFVTGGDSKYFEFPSKSSIFAVENLTLLGLFYLYQLNA